MQMLLCVSPSLLSGWVLIYRQCVCPCEPLKSSGFAVFIFCELALGFYSFPIQYL